MSTTTDMSHKQLMLRIGAINVGSMLVAGVTAIAYIAGWQATMEQRMLSVEASARVNREDVRDLTKLMSEQSREVAVLAERLKPIVDSINREVQRRNGN